MREPNQPKLYSSTPPADAFHLQNKRLFALTRQSDYQDERDGWAIMGLLNINVLGVSHREKFILPDGSNPEGRNTTIYNVEYQMQNGKWAKFAFETWADEDEVPFHIINVVQDYREVQKEILANLGA